MASLNNIVSVSISQNTVGVSRAGFGRAMILSSTAAWVERYRLYTEIDEVAVDFALDSPEYKAAAKIFAQSPKVTDIMIGRAALAPTQVTVVGVVAVQNSHTYQARIAGEGVTEETIEFASDVDATNDEIIAGLVTAANLVVGANYTAAATGTVGSQVMTMTATAAGDWFSVEILDVADLSVKSTHADPGVATDLAAIKLASDDWYSLITLFNSEAYVLAAAGWIETQDKLYWADVAETTSVTTTSTGSVDTLDKLAALNYQNTAGCYYPKPDSFFAAAFAGKFLPTDVGEATAMFKTLAGISVVNQTATHRANLLARNANSYESNAGVDMTFQGQRSDGDFIDTTRNLHWYKDEMAKSVFEVMAGLPKVSYDDPGIAVVENAMRGVNDRAVLRGVFTADPAPTVSVPKASTVSAANKAVRLLPDLKASGTLAGAIHKAQVAVTVSV